MATTKARKTTKKAAKKAAGPSAEAAAKARARAAKPAKKTPAKKTPVKKMPVRRPPAKKAPRRKDVPVVVTIDSTSLTLQLPPGSPAKAYEMILFIDDSKLSAAQRSKIEAFANEHCLKLLSLAVGKGYAGP